MNPLCYFLCPTAVVEAEKSSCREDDNCNNDVQTNFRVFLGLFLARWYSITFYRFYGRIVHENRVCGRFCLSTDPYSFRSGRCLIDNGRFSVNRVMDHDCFCVTIYKRCVMEPYSLRLSVNLRSRCLRCCCLFRYLARAQQAEERR